MRLTFVVATIALATVMGLLQSLPDSPSYKTPQWQEVDQLCGILRFVTPKKKTIIVHGKAETRLYANLVKDAEATLYRGTALDKTCCPDTGPAGRTRSNNVGRFEFSGFQNGWYWLRIKKDDYNATIPLHTTGDFDGKSCRDRSVGRIFTVDTQPPKVETRIY